MNTKKIVMSLIIMLLLLNMSVDTVFAVPKDDINAEEVFLKQTPYDVECTLVAVTNMLRRKAILNEDTNWSNITHDALRPSAWSSNSGLLNNFQYGHFSVSSEKFQSTSLQDKEAVILSLLSQHPEGIVVFRFGNPHAILITDYIDGTYYVADPSPYYPSGRIPITSSSVALDEVNKYWYISYDATPLPDDSNVEEKQEPQELLQYSYRSRKQDYIYTTSTSSSLDGWECTGSNGVGSCDKWSEWSEWSHDFIEETDSRQVETRTIQMNPHEEIYLGRYYSEAKNDFSSTPLDSTYLFEGGWFDSSQVVFKGQVFSGGRSDCYSISGYHYYFFEIGDHGGETRSTYDETLIEYRYREQLVGPIIYNFRKYEYGDWSAWSEWSDTPIEESETVQVRTRVVFQ